MMIKNNKYLGKIFLILSFILSSQIVYAQGIGSEADIEDDETPPRPPGGGPSGVNNDADKDVPVDMHTSALLVAGMGLIASYAYFARRRKENIL